jgi:hypothetical protein
VNSLVIGSVLRSLRELEATLVRVKRLAALQRIYAETVPQDLAERSGVVLERASAVVVAAETSAIAHKLKQLAPRIVEKIVKFAPELTSIQVEVQVTLRSDIHPRARPAIGPRGLTSLRELRDALPESPLREALARMVRRGVVLDGEDQPLKDQKGENDQRED